MDWRAARTAAAAVLMGASGLFGSLGSPLADAGSVAPGPAESACPEPIVLETADGATRLACLRTDLAPLLTLCSPLRAVYRGDRLRALPKSTGCRTGVVSASAARRLRLGLHLDVNRASVDELAAVPGIGPVTATRIVAGRPWPSVDALRAVRGIGAGWLARIGPRLRASPSRPPLWPSRPPPGASSPRRP